MTSPQPPQLPKASLTTPGPQHVDSQGAQALPSHSQLRQGRVGRKDTHPGGGGGQRVGDWSLPRAICALCTPIVEASGWPPKISDPSWQRKEFYQFAAVTPLTTNFSICLHLGWLVIKYLRSRAPVATTWCTAGLRDETEGREVTPEDSPGLPCGALRASSLDSTC